MTYYKYPNGEVHNLPFATSDPDAVQLTNAEGKRERAKYCQRELRKILKPGSRVYVVLRSVSSGGMRRKLSLFITQRDKQRGQIIRRIDQLAADAMGWSLDKEGNLIADGCGMDMGFHAVYCLGSALWPKGTRKPHGTRNGQADCAGGYALKHEWL